MPQLRSLTLHIGPVPDGGMEEEDFDVEWVGREIARFIPEPGNDLLIELVLMGDAAMGMKRLRFRQVFTRPLGGEWSAGRAYLQEQTSIER